MLFNDPLWFYATYMYHRARQRASLALSGNPESGALTLEWIVIGGILVAAASAAALVFKSAIGKWEAGLTKGS